MGIGVSCSADRQCWAKITEEGTQSNNLYLPIGHYITLTGALREGAAIGVATIPFEGGTLQISVKERRSSYYADAAQFFTADADSLTVKADSKDQCLKLAYAAE